MLAEVFQALQIAAFLLVLGISGAIFLFRRFPTGGPISRERWMAKLALSLVIVGPWGLRHAAIRAVVLATAVTGFFLVAQGDVARSFGLWLFSLVFCWAMLAVTEVLRVADMRDEPFNARLEAARAAQKTKRRSGGR